MSLVKPIYVIIKYRKILKATAGVDLKAKFAGSLLGTIWVFLYPMLLLMAYSFIYIFVLQVRYGQMSEAEYVLLIFSGLIPFLGFTEGLSLSVVSVSSNSSLIKNTLFPVDIIPVKAVILSQSTQLVSFTLLFIALIIYGKLTVFAVFAVPVWFFQVIFGIGVGWVVSCLNVYLKDLQSMINLINMFLMMISPIAYTVDMIPSGLKPFLAINPLYYFISAYQSCLVMGRLPEISVMLTIILLSSVTFVFGFWFFDKMKQIFSDNI